MHLNFRLFLHASFALLLCALLGVLWAARPAAAQVEVRLEGGKTLEASAIRFDGQRFQITTSGGMVFPKPIEEIAGMSVNVAAYLEQIRRLEQTVEHLKSRLESVSTGLERLPEIKKENDALQKTVSELEDKLKGLRKELDETQQYLTEAQQAAEALQEAQVVTETLPGHAARVEVSRPEVQQKPDVAGLVTISGSITNNETRPLDKVVLEITPLQSNGTPLGQIHTFVMELAAGSSRRWVVDTQSNPADIARVEVETVSVTVTRRKQTAGTPPTAPRTPLPQRRPAPGENRQVPRRNR